MSSTSEIRSIAGPGGPLRIHVRRGVNGSGVALVLANGIGASIELLQPFVDALPAAIEVVRFDVPGVGGSPRRSWPYRIPALARMLRRALDDLGYDELDMLGVSWGGGLAQQFAMTPGSRCRRLVLVSTATGALMVPASPRVLARMATPRRYRDPDHAQRIAGTIYGGAMRTEPEQAARLLGQMANRVGSSTGYWMQLLALGSWTSLPCLWRIRQPTLILAGDDDPIIPLLNARIMATLIPHARLHIYHDGHLALITDAATLAPLIADFLDEPDTPRAPHPIE
jgi:poly(3-hydroxyalkanoate) depolymerase